MCLAETQRFCKVHPPHPRPSPPEYRGRGELSVAQSRRISRRPGWDILSEFLTQDTSGAQESPRVSGWRVAAKRSGPAQIIIFTSHAHSVFPTLP